MTKGHLFAAMLGAGLLALSLASGCGDGYVNAGTRRVDAWRDEARGVTCWIVSGTGTGSGSAISCLPDSALKAARP